MVPDLMGSGPGSDTGSTLYAGSLNGLDPDSGSATPGFGAPPSARGPSAPPDSGIVGGSFAGFGPLGMEPGPPSGGTPGSTTYRTGGSISPVFFGLPYVAVQTAWDMGGDGAFAPGPIGSGETSYVPEPATLTLMLTGVLALAAICGKRKRG